MISSQISTKDTVKDLECLRHTLLNGTVAIAQSLKTIELRLQYMSTALKVFEEMLREDNDSLDKTGCFRTPKPPNP